MKTKIRIEESIGKTLAAVHCTSYEKTAYLIFTDDTFATVSAIGGYDGDVYVEADQYIDPEMSRFDLVRAGVMTEEESAAIEARLAAKRQQEREQRERMEYERLKSKFGQ